MTHTAFDVFRFGQWLERVYYVVGTTADEALRELLASGYPSNITVHLAAKKTS